MSGPEPPNRPDARAHDENQFDVSRTRSGTGPMSNSSWVALFEADRLARRRRRRIAGVVATALLALAVLASAIAGVRSQVLGFFAAGTPTPTTSLQPAEASFYLLPNPPGVRVTLDGHALARLPEPGDSAPLRLTPGHHIFALTSQLFPFAAQSCTVSVPALSTDTCPLVAPHDLPAAVPGRVLALHASLATLQGGAGAQLTQAIQEALTTSRSETIVQSGERYFFYVPGSGGGGGPVVAKQPLLASLGFDFVQQQGYPEPCLAFHSAIPCRFPGQDCTQLCTVAQPPAAVAGAPDGHVWIAAAMVDATWDYATPTGRVVARNLSEIFGIQLLTLRITWEGASWRVTPIVGHLAGLPVADDAVCDPARAWIAQNNAWSFMVDDPPPGSQTQFVSDARPTDGCVAVLNPGSGTPAVFLERFGVLLAVNELAAGNSGLPRADAGEQRLARQIAAQAGIHL
jgi:hypothetical protein